MSRLTSPDPRLRCCVVVPAHDEEDLVGACVTALVNQRGVRPGEYEVLLLLDHCTDRTEEHARAAAAGSDTPLHLLQSGERGVGATRRAGMGAASDRLDSLRRPQGLIACTDADSVPAPDWVAAQLAVADRGARAIGGRIELSAAEGAVLGPGVLARRARQARRRHLRLLGADTPAGSTFEHWQFSGASMAVTAQTYRSVGGMSRRLALEDEAFERALHVAGIPIQRSLAVRVTTSGRLRGRAPAGLAHDLAEAVRSERG